MLGVIMLAKWQIKGCIQTIELVYGIACAGAGAFVASIVWNDYASWLKKQIANEYVARVTTPRA